MAERRAEPKGCGSLNNISVRTTQGGAEANDQGDLRSATTTRRSDPVQEPRDNSNTTNEQPTSSHHSFTPSIHTICSQHLFTARIHSTYSQHSFTPDVHTGTTDHDSSTATARRHDGSTARRRTQPEKCGGNHQRANHQRDYGPTGLRTNGSADAHRVLGADRESRSMMHE